MVVAFSVPAALVASGGPAGGGGGGIFTASLIGAEESPPNASPATGFATVTLDATETTITVEVEFSGLLATTTAAHIHAPAPPGTTAPIVFSFVGFPLGVTSGTYSSSFPITPAEVSDLRAGLSYVNIHSVMFQAGEIRGQLIEEAPQAPPPSVQAPSEPAPEPVTAGPRLTG